MHLLHHHTAVFTSVTVCYLITLGSLHYNTLNFPPLGLLTLTRGRNLKTLACGLVWTGNNFEYEAFRKRQRPYNHVIYLHEFYSNTNPK